MRLVNCHIDGFGKLRNYEYKFDEGLNVIRQNNGFGKSTFVAFLRGIFYGLSGARTSFDKGKNEPKNYKPWCGDLYGGYVIFEKEGKTYRIIRQFKEDGKDIVQIVEEESNLVSNDFEDRYHIGNELFGMDANSFVRSILFSQNDFSYELTGEIHALIGDIVEDVGDVNRYENVMKDIKDYLNHNSDRTKTGSLRKLRERISGYEYELKEEKSVDNNLMTLAAELEARMAEYQNLQEQKRELEKSRKLSVDRREMEAKRLIYDKLNKSYEERDERFRQIRSLFGKTVPTKAWILDMSKRLEELKQYEFELKRKECALEEEVISREKDIKERIGYYDEEFAYGYPDGERIAQISEEWAIRTEKSSSVQMKKDYIKVKEEAISTKEIADRKNVATVRLVIIIGIVFAILGIVLSVYHSMFIGITGFGAAMVAIAMAWRFKNRKSRVDMLREELEVLRQEIEADEQEVYRIEKEVREYLSAYRKDYSEKTVVNKLLEIQQDYEKCLSLMSELDDVSRLLYGRKRELEEARIEYAECKKVIEAEFAECNCKMKYDNYEDLLYYIRENKLLLNEAFHNKEADREALEQFVLENKLENISDLYSNTNPECAMSIEEVEEKISFVSQSIENIQNILRQLELQKDQILQRKEQLMDVRLSMNECKVSYYKAKQEYEDMEGVSRFLSKAKENLTNRYVMPIQNRFDEYYKTLIKESNSVFKIDGNLDLSYEEDGLRRKNFSLSQGYKDLTNICIRLAYVDSMFKEDKPFIVMDDPFVNLDDDKQRFVRLFLEKLAENYQIIYLSCHL